LPRNSRNGTIVSVAAVNSYEAALTRFRGARQVLQTLAPENLKGSRFLDISCGIGNMLLAASRAGALEVVGIDLNLGEFGDNFFQEIAQSEGIRTDQITMIEQDFCSYEADRVFDVVTCFDVLEHVADPARFIQNIYRHTAHNGIAVIDICPLYYSPVGHHLFSYFDRETMPWAHLYTDFDALLKEQPIDGWTWPLFKELNRITAGKLRDLVRRAGFRIIDEHGSNAGEDAFQRFKDRIRIEEVPSATDLFHEWIRLYCEKDGHGTERNYTVNPFDVTANGPELDGMAKDFAAGRCRLDQSTLLDFTFGSRLIRGRWPTQEEIGEYRSAAVQGVGGIVDALLASPELEARYLAARIERPGASCIIMTETPDGLRFFFSAQDTFVGFPVAVGVFERDVCGAIARLIRKGMRCLDVGSNIGFYSVRMAAAVGESGKVYSFEPDPFNYSLLLKNRAENRMENIITTFKVACGHEDREVLLRRDSHPSNFAGAHVSEEATKPGQDTAVSLRRVDGLIPVGDHIDLIKIDIEGYELFALRGMQRIVSERRPVIVCEFNTVALNRHGPGTGARLLAELSELNYSLFEADPFSKGTFKVFSYDGGPDVFLNLVCLPHDYEMLRGR
jgi:FkbM family methyltransferase